METVPDQFTVSIIEHLLFLGTFRHFENPQQFWLSINNMTTLDSLILTAFSKKSVNYIDIWANPWKCDCQIQWLKVCNVVC